MKPGKKDENGLKIHAMKKRGKEEVWLRIGDNEGKVSKENGKDSLWRNRNILLYLFLSFSLGGKGGRKKMMV